MLMAKYGYMNAYGSMLSQPAGASGAMKQSPDPVMNMAFSLLDKAAAKTAPEQFSTQEAAVASALEKMLKSSRKKLDFVIELKVDDKALVERISGRFSCAKCGAGYHDKFKRTKVDGVCDSCGSKEFIRRADDNVETVQNRLLAYYKETSPLIGYYFAKGLLDTVDGMGAIDEVGGSIEKVLGKQG